jgi:hypothetical protein
MDRGNQLIRSGEHSPAVKELQRAIVLNPGLVRLVSSIVTSGQSLVKNSSLLTGAPLASIKKTEGLELAPLEVDYH